MAPGCRWIKKPAARSPGWLEKPERIAALAMLTVVGGLVDRVVPRQVRLSLLPHDQQVPGKTGDTATPTAAVGFAVLAHVALGQIQMGHREVQQVDGVQPHPLLICDALGLNHAWYAAPSADKNGKCGHTPCTWA